MDTVESSSKVKETDKAVETTTEGTATKTQEAQTPVTEKVYVLQMDHARFKKLSKLRQVGLNTFDAAEALEATSGDVYAAIVWHFSAAQKTTQ